MPRYTDPSTGKSIVSTIELTPDELEEAFSLAANSTTQITPQQQEQPSSDVGLGQKLVNRGKDFIGAYTNPQYRDNPARMMLRATGAVAGAINDIVEPVAKPVVESAIQAATFGNQDKLYGLIKKPIETVSNVYGKFKSQYPEIAQDVSDFTNIVGTFPPIKGTQMSTMFAKSKATKIGDMLDKAAGQEIIDRQIKDAVSFGMQKGIQGTSRGKGNFSALKELEDKAVSAVTDIVRNKNNIQLTTSSGEVVTGKLPQTVKEMSEAIPQVKNKIWQEVSDRLKMASGRGVVIDGDIISNAMMDEAKKLANNIEAKEAYEYAINRAMEYKGRQFTPEQLQSSLQELNQKLSPFWADKSKSTPAMRKVDLVRRNALANALDKTMDSLGVGFQDLKNRWGGLKQIEKDVAHRVVIDGRRHLKGLVDFSEIWTIPELAIGLLTMNPQKIGLAVGVDSMKRYVKWVNSPDRITSKMFRDVDKLLSKKERLGFDMFPNVNIPISKQKAIASGNPQEGSYVVGGIPATVDRSGRVRMGDYGRYVEEINNPHLAGTQQNNYPNRLSPFLPVPSGNQSLVVQGGARNIYPPPETDYIVQPERISIAFRRLNPSQAIRRPSMKRKRSIYDDWE